MDMDALRSTMLPWLGWAGSDRAHKMFDLMFPGTIFLSA